MKSYYFCSDDGENNHVDRTIPPPVHVQPDKTNEDSHVEKTMSQQAHAQPDLARLRTLASVVGTCQNVDSSECQDTRSRISARGSGIRQSYTQSDQSNTRPRIPEIRPTCDVHIIYDTEHIGANNPVELVKLLEDELEKHDYTYTDCGRDCLPGRSTDQQQIDMITQADFIVCFVSFCQQTGHVSAGLINHLRKALTIKQRPGLTNRVIPVFCYMPVGQVTGIVTAHLLEMILMNHIIASHRDLTYIEKVLQALAATPSGKITYLLLHNI